MLNYLFLLYSYKHWSSGQNADDFKTFEVAINVTN